FLILSGACAPSSGIRPDVEPVPSRETSVAANTASHDADSGPVPLVVVGHKWSRGFPTYVHIYRQANSKYLLITESRLGTHCVLRNRRIIAATDTVALERSLAILDPTRLSADDECHKSVRDGSSWFVGARVDDHWIWRSRMQDGLDTPTCREMGSAFSEIMA